MRSICRRSRLPRPPWASPSWRTPARSVTNVFRACFIDPFQGQKMADYAVNRLNAKTAAVFFQTGSDYSEGLKNAFVEEAEKLGLEIVAEEAFPEGDKDFKAQMTNIAAKDPDVVFCPIYYGEAGLAISAARAGWLRQRPSSAATASAPSRIMPLRKISKAPSTAPAMRPALRALPSLRRTTARPSRWTPSRTCSRRWPMTRPC